VIQLFSLSPTKTQQTNNVHEGTIRDADQDEALHDAYNVETGEDIDIEFGDITSFEATNDADYVQSGEDIGIISVGDITTFIKLRETITTFAASNNFLVNVHSDSALKYKGKTRIRFLYKASGRQRKQKNDDTVEVFRP
jgi:hypothetical protein